MRIGFSHYTTPRRVLPATPLERGTLVRGKTGGIPRFCGMALVALFIAIPAFAETDAKTVTSKKYVDDQIATKQAILNANGTDLRDNVVMYTDTAGEVTSKPISSTLTGNNIDSNLPTVGAVNTGLAT